MAHRTATRTVTADDTSIRGARRLATGPVARGVALALAVLALGACSNDDDDDGDVTPDTPTTPGTPPTETGGMDGSPVGNFAVVANDGMNAGSVTFFSPDLATRDRTLATGANEGIAFDDDGTLYQNADAESFTGLRAFSDATSRADNAGYDEANEGDRTIGATPGKGLAFIDADDDVLISCDVTDDAAPMKVFAVDGDAAAAPTATYDLDGAKCWDTFYAASDDRLYVALTNGTLGIFDDFVDGLEGDMADDGAPDRTVTPVGADGTVLSTNLHGVFVEGDTVLVSDVGDAASPTDGLLFTFTDDGSLDGNVETTSIGGPATMLGNPVDAVLLDGRAIIAEKSNDAVLVFDDVATLEGDVAPDYTAMFTKPESVELAPTPGDDDDS